MHFASNLQNQFHGSGNVLELSKGDRFRPTYFNPFNCSMSYHDFYKILWLVTKTPQR